MGMVGPCSRRRTEPLMACLAGHRLDAPPLNRVIIIRHSWFLNITVAESSGGDDCRRLLDPASYSVSIQFRQSRFSIKSQSQQTELRIFMTARTAQLYRQNKTAKSPTQCHSRISHNGGRNTLLVWNNITNHLQLTDHLPLFAYPRYGYSFFHYQSLSPINTRGGCHEALKHRDRVTCTCAGKIMGEGINTRGLSM